MVEPGASLAGETPARIPAADPGRRAPAPTACQLDPSWVGARRRGGRL